MESETLERIIEIDQRSQSNSQRLEKLEKDTSAIYELAKNVAVMSESMKVQNATLAEVKADVQQLKSIPAKRWEQVVDKVAFGLIGILLGAVVSYVVSQL